METYKIQRTRLERAIRELFPGCKVIFDDSQAPNKFKMQVADGVTGKILLETYGHWLVREMAEKSDGQLRALLKAWRREFLRRERSDQSAPRPRLGPDVEPT